MRRYIITLAIIAVAIGALFQGAETTGVRLFKMFATIGIFLFGVVGTMALTRLQSRSGLKELEATLKSMEPEWFLTDWAFQGHGKPDFLAVGPAGLLAICVDEVAQSVKARKAEERLAKGRQRALDSAAWLRQRLEQPDVAIHPVLVLTRRQTNVETMDGVTVMNPSHIAEFVAALPASDLMDKPTRVKLTRLYRGA